MQPLRIGIDVTPLRGTRTGIGNHLEHLLLALREQPGLETTCFTGARWDASFDATATSAQAHTRAERLLASVSRLLGPLSLPVKTLYTRASVRGRFNACATLGLDAVHCHDLLPCRAGLPEILTVFDISCFRRPELHRAARVAWQRRHLPDALARAARIITISEFSRREIHAHFHIPLERIAVTHCGVGPEFMPRDARQAQAALAPLGLTPGEYLLSVGTLEPRKNLATLVRAHGALPAALQQRYPLVIAGKPGWMMEEFMRLVAPALARGTVRMPGYVASAHLPWLYAGARAFLYPSVYEGFGLPALEALACGTPAAVSDCSSLPEVVGDAALRVAALDAGGWQQAMLALVEDRDLRERLARIGIAQAAPFTWNRTARLTMDVYASVAGRRPPP